MGCPQGSASINNKNMMNSSIRTPNKPSSGRYGGPTTTPQQLFGNMMESIPEGEGNGYYDRAWSGARGRTPRRNARHGKGAANSRANAHSKSKTTSAAAGTATTTTNGTASSASASHRTSYTPSKKENSTNNNIARTNSNDHSSSVTHKESSLVISPTALKAAKKVANIFKKEKGKNAVLKDASTRTEFAKTKDASTQTLAETVYVQHIPCVIRSVHDRTRGDLDRCNLGAGNVVILKSCLENENGNVFVCQFVGDDGSLKFQSDIPDKSDAHPG